MSNKEQLQANNLELAQCINDVNNLQTSGGDVKLFETMLDMDNDTTAKDGDLAVVYGSSIQNGTGTTEFSQINFPDVVVLPSAVTSSSSCMMRAGRNGGDVQLSATRFRFVWYGPPMISVAYTSTDGITYTKTEGDSIVEFENPIKCYYEKEWNDNFGYFMQTGSYDFEGLFSYLPYADTQNLYLIPFDNFTITPTKINYTLDNAVGPYDINKIKNVANKIKSVDTNFDKFTICMIDGKLSLAYGYGNNANTKRSQTCRLYSSDRSSCLPGLSGCGYRTDVLYEYNMYYYNINLDEGTFSNKFTLTPEKTFTPSNDADTYTWTYYVYAKTSCDYVGSSFEFTNNDWNLSSTSVNYTDSPYTSASSKLELFGSKYVLAANQLTLSDTTQLLSGIIAYSKDGIVTGTLAEGPLPDFNDVNAEVYAKIQLKYDDMVPRTLTDTDHSIDKNIYIIPTRSDGEPLFDTSNLTSMYGVFTDCKNLLIIPTLNTSNATSMQQAFQNCSNLVNISLLDTSNVSNVMHMFQRCTNLKNIPLFDTSNATDMTNMFYDCTNLKSIPLLDIHNVTNMLGTFYNCKSLTEIPLLNVNSVTNMGKTFSGCINLTTIPLLDTSNVTDMNNIFDRCENLIEIPELDTHNVTNMFRMFWGCVKLTEIPLLDTSNVTDIGAMFYKCSSLIIVPSLNTSNATNMNSMFDGCTSLTTIPLIDTSNVTSMNSMFNGCNSLSNDSLNNVLSICKNSKVTTTSNKTLKYVGLTKEQANKCKTLSNYSAFTSAGWTTGY